MADRNQIGRKSVDFFNTYVAERGVRNADLAPAGEVIDNPDQCQGLC